MTQEEKAKAYDNALDMAQCILKIRCIEGTSDSFHRKDLEDIFPQLKESENKNEEIRKLLIRFVILEMPCNYSKEFSKEQCIDWLEKQGDIKNKLRTMLDNSLSRETKESWNKFLDEQKPVKIDECQAKMMFIWALEKVEERINKGYKLTDCDKNSWWNDFKTYALSGNKGEQKSAWNREDEQNLNAALGYINDEHLCRWLKDAIHAKYDKTAWSEEDREMRMRVLNYLSSRCSVFDYEEVEHWLNSLKERVQPQPKQEWSEEDESRINHIITFMSDKERIKDTETMFPIEEDIRWLKSLRPQKQWKPSDEQMEYLSAAIEESNENPVVESLYQDLKKLRRTEL